MNSSSMHKSMCLQPLEKCANKILKGNLMTEIALIC